jgi:hypothetical protein
MILSFSIEAMRPMIVAGLRQRRGEVDYLGATMRVKRQTVRALGPRNKLLLERAKRANKETGVWALDYDLQCWWKSRTPERELLGDALRVHGPIIVMPVTIRRTDVPRLSVELPGVMAVWHDLLSDIETSGVAEFAQADGFDTVAAFRDFFVPNPGDQFRGALFKW